MKLIQLRNKKFRFKYIYKAQKLQHDFIRQIMSQLF